MIRFFLLNSHIIRYWAAQRIIQLMATDDFYKPAKLIAPQLVGWLDSLEDISPSQLRRLALVLLLHWYDQAKYYGIEFTTAFHKNPRMITNFNLYIPCLVYNALSDLPIKNIEEYEEQLGGFPPISVDPMRYFVNYVMGDQEIRLELTVDRLVYELGESVEVSLQLQNLTLRSIIIENPQGPTIKFSIQTLKGNIVKEQIHQSPEEPNQIAIPPENPITINWSSDLQEKSSYFVKAQVYIPNYKKVVELQVGIEYGVKPMFVMMSTRQICTL